MASNTTDLPEAPSAQPEQQQQQQQLSAQDQLRAAAASSPQLQQQASTVSNTGTGNDPFQCLWQGCHERTQSAEALYVRNNVLILFLLSDFS